MADSGPSAPPRSSLGRRLRTALTNPAYVLELIAEGILTRFWTWSFLARCVIRGIRVGTQPEIFGPCVLRKAPRSRIELGDRVKIISSSWRSSTANCGPSKLRTHYPSAAIVIGHDSGMTGGSIVARSKTIRIGNRCMLAPNVTIVDSDFHILWPPERRWDTWETDIDRDVTVEDNVWIGMGAIILKGVTIGQNSVIAAGSVVVDDVPPNCLAGGNPARVLRSFP